MKKPLSHILLPAVIALVVSAMTSCGDDEYYEYGNSSFDMVTYAGNGTAGDSYINYPVNDIAPVTLIDAATNASSAGLKSGTRLLLNYAVNSRNSDGSLNITAKSYTKAITDTLRYVPGTTPIPMDSVSLNSIWRTDRYINIYCRVKYTETARVMALVADYRTIRNDTVHCYLMHNMMDATAYFWRRCYASYDISSVWNLQSCKTVRIHIDDVNYPERRYYDFTKTN